jgi:hypothetical protein
MEDIEPEFEVKETPLDAINNIDTSFLVEKMTGFKEYWSKKPSLSKEQAIGKLKEQYKELIMHPLIHKITYPKKDGESDLDDEVALLESLDHPSESEGENTVKLTENDDDTITKKPTFEHQFFFGEGNVEAPFLILIKCPSESDIKNQIIYTTPQARKLLDEIIDGLGGITNCYIGYVFPFCIFDPYKPDKKDSKAGAKQKEDEEQGIPTAYLKLGSVRDIQHFYNLTSVLMHIIKPKIVVTIGMQPLLLAHRSFSLNRKVFLSKTEQPYNIYEIVKYDSDQYENIKISPFTIAALPSPWDIINFKSPEKRLKVQEKMKSWNPVVSSLPNLVKEYSLNGLLKKGLDVKVKEQDDKKRKLAAKKFKEKKKEEVAKRMKIENNDRMGMKRTKTITDFFKKT